MDTLPPPEEQDWLLDCLRLLVLRRGASRLLEARLIREADLGPWTPTVAGVAAHAARLVELAPLERLDCVVRSGDRPTAPHRALYHPDTPLWLVAVDGRAAHVGVEASALVDGGTVAGLLAHELAHAWRLRHRLAVEEPDDEERLTDLTMVYLGFGVLAAHRAARIKRRRSAWTSLWGWAPSEGASLSVPAVAFLLASQVIARRSSCLATWSLARALPAEAQRPFARALRHLRHMPGGLPWRLRLPPTRPALVRWRVT